MDDSTEKEGEEARTPDEGSPVLEGAPGTERAEEGGLDLSDAISFHSSGSPIDGTVDVAVLPDGMSATANFYPPKDEGLPIEPGFVYELLRRVGVVSGLLEEEIAQAMMSCNLDRKIVRNVVVAKGSLPVAELPEHASIESRFSGAGRVIADNQQRVDFRAFASYYIVRKGDTIATILPKQPGVPGVDVRGNQTPFPRQSPPSYAAGRNVERREDKLVALVDGRLTIESGRIEVDEVMLVKGEVDFHTGNIAFPGDVVIEGSVHDGFKVQSGGSIVCKSTMDAFEVSAKKDLVCAQGIIGKRRGDVRVGGEIKAKYLQNCRVAARGAIHIATAVVNCRVYTLGSLELGDKGVLMGGEAFSTHGLRCGRLGNEAFQRTVVHAGIDFTAQQKLDQANERMRLLAARQRQIDHAAQSNPGPEVERAKAEIAKAAAALRAQISQLLAQVDADDGAVVECKGDIFPGVVIDICRVSIVVEEKLHACRFRLDKAAGRVVVER
jgi:Predicted polymerase, most proteins contain PALM domain, HD hydrolase domain and Zn-ribbon domain